MVGLGVHGLCGLCALPRGLRVVEAPILEHAQGVALYGGKRCPELVAGVSHEAALVGEAVGYVCHARDLAAGTLHDYAYELADGVSWLEANPFVLNTLAQAAEERPDSLTFSLGKSHPLYNAFPDPPLY
jgi:hypothetical protein